MFSDAKLKGHRIETKQYYIYNYDGKYFLEHPH